MTAFLNTNPTPRKKSAHPFSSLERSKKVAASTTRVLLLRVAVGVFLRRLVLLLRQKSVAAHVSTAKTTLFDEMCLLFRLLLMTTTLCATKKYTTWETNLEKVSINFDKGARETTLFVFFFSKSLAWMEKKYGAAPFSFLSGVSCVSLSLSFFCVLGRRTDKKDKKDEKKDPKNKKKQRKKEKKKSTRISTAQKKNYYYFRFVSSSSSSHSSSQKKRGEESGRRSEKRKRERHTHTHTQREREL